MTKNRIKTTSTPAPKMDAVYVVGTDSGMPDHGELRYSMRSLAQNFSDLGKIFIIGYCPGWVDTEKVIHIPFPDPYTSNKDANLINKVMIAALHPEISEQFLFCSDDNYLLKRISSSSIKPYAFENLEQDPMSGQSKWQRRLHNTYRRLKAVGVETVYNFDGHIPMPYSKKDYIQAMLMHDYGYELGYTINTLYLNQVLSEVEMMPEGFKHGYYGTSDFSPEGATWFNHDDAGLTKKVKEYLESKFSKKCEFEV